MKRRLLPLLAQTIVYLSGNMSATFKWDANYKSILDPKNRVVQELHAISSATKPKSGWLAAEVLRECRQAMGGHGYNSASKIGALYNDHDINNTWEGDNTVLLQQATKFVLDKFMKVMKGKEVKAPILEFLK
jgi:acyl-CoA oxidase